MLWGLFLKAVHEIICLSFVPLFQWNTSEAAEEVKYTISEKLPNLVSFMPVANISQVGSPLNCAFHASTEVL